MSSYGVQLCLSQAGKGGRSLPCVSLPQAHSHSGTPVAPDGQALLGPHQTLVGDPCGPTNRGEEVSFSPGQSCPRPPTSQFWLTRLGVPMEALSGFSGWPWAGRSCDPGAQFLLKTQKGHLYGCSELSPWPTWENSGLGHRLDPCTVPLTPGVFLRRGGGGGGCAKPPATSMLSLRLARQLPATLLCPAWLPIAPWGSGSCLVPAFCDSLLAQPASLPPLRLQTH